MRKNIQPPSLVKGDKVALISPSGNIENVYVEGAKAVLEDWGLQVEELPHTRSKLGRYAGTIEDRLTDLQTSMDDPSIKMIFCTRGGYGMVHLLEKLNFSKIRKHPKWLVGYSDITALHLAFLKHGISSIHAPMAKHLTENSTDQASIYLKQMLMSTVSEYTIEPHPLNITGETIGNLIGGNLAVFCGLAGTKYTNTPRNSILFIEDIGECAYKIDRMLWNLKLSGILKRIKGLIVGQFTCCEEDPQMYDTIYTTIQEMIKQYKIPTAFNYPIGHVQNNFPILHGGLISLKIEKNLVLHRNL